MAVLVFVLAVFVPSYSDHGQAYKSQEKSLVADATFSNAPNLSQAPEPLPKLNVLFFALPKLWAMLVALNAPELQEYKTVFLQFFIQKINFVFVSTQAP